jgi:hypothetical protein
VKGPGCYHAPVAETIDFGGRDIDPVLNDAETGVWGLGAGPGDGRDRARVVPQGEFPADPAAAEMSPELIEAANRISLAWTDVVAASKS